MINKIYCEDCIEGMKKIADNTIDCIICDLPYGTILCSWDVIIPFDKLWDKHLLKKYSFISKNIQK